MPDLDNLLWFLAICAAGLGVWLSLNRRRTRFTITISRGRVARTRGQAPDGYVRDVERMCEFWSIADGHIRGVRRSGKRVRIAVGGGIPQQHRQAFQNAWDNPV